MRFLRRGKIFWLTAAGIILVMAFFVYTLMLPQKKTAATNNTNSNRQQYAALYDAAWRQDDGKDAILMTATVLVPPTVSLLGTDSERSSAEEQIWNDVKDVDVRTIPIVLTLDSVTGTVTDDAIQKSLSLSADAGPKYTVASLTPVIAPTRVVNTSATASSQMWVALFSADGDIDWNALGTLKLTVNGIGGEKTRIFSWVEPKLLLEVQ